ncbi:ABC transporter substrate-binding protein [Aliarcobacter thereius]|uniref:histidine kinase n=2 Tax=Aliarcobacter thereius TaxID=544718 RepID=A0A1C0B7V0_9BACT|nr:ABC transporter substrate-binding protein [Aliarcobacter thereius]OCL94059.1 Sensor protein FixL [Aliarcobacter thereius]OCL95453.1 Sensor protein FixL [Aliarcobacter thereius LMG 24486]OCL99653.1 Sensor protein FixL [Aliarcobacter thereius]QBF16559.1 NMT1 domain-containing signal transduction histidine kinase [Aliarcobacter thereius LMG 24486]
MNFSIKHKIYIYIFLLLLHTNIYSKELKKVTLQLSWFDQFQFAGYYMAKEMGYYEDIGLDVEIIPFEFGLNIPKMVNENIVDFSIGRENLILEKTRYKNITALYSIFQASPLILLTTEKSGIDSIFKFKNKTIMATKDDENEISLKAMMVSNNVNLKSMKFIEHTHNIYDLINNKVDIISAYTSKSPYILQKNSIKYNVFYPKDYGFDMYSDFLITNINFVKHNYKSVNNFKQASLKGWEYAYNNIEKSVDLILKKYNRQNLTKDELIFEANELKYLSYLNGSKLGEIKQDKVQRIFDLYNLLGLVPKDSNIDGFIFTKEENKFNRWIITNIIEKIDLAFIWNMIIVIFVLSILVVYRQYLITKVNKKLKNLVKIKTNRLKIMNQKLANRIKKELEINLEKDRILAQQQKMISMGQMIENIAHQWRQPLSIISTRASMIKLKNDLKMLEKDELNEALEQILNTATYLSQTIDDFRDFFRPRKEKDIFCLSKSIYKSIELSKLSFENSDIKLIFEEKDIDIFGYETELIQVFINAINNSKDALTQKNIEDKLIIINLIEKNSKVYIEFIDSALGIEDDILHKVFEPYFTTKHQYSGTGIGLYMSSEIVTKHMKGEIFMKNIDFEYKNKKYKGAKLTIVLDVIKK